MAGTVERCAPAPPPAGAHITLGRGCARGRTSPGHRRTTPLPLTRAAATSSQRRAVWRCKRRGPADGRAVARAGRRRSRGPGLLFAALGTRALPAWHAGAARRRHDYVARLRWRTVGTPGRAAPRASHHGALARPPQTSSGGNTQLGGCTPARAACTSFRRRLTRSLRRAASTVQRRRVWRLAAGAYASCICPPLFAFALPIRVATRRRVARSRAAHS